MERKLFFLFVIFCFLECGKKVPPPMPVIEKEEKEIKSHETFETLQVSTTVDTVIKVYDPIEFIRRIQHKIFVSSNANERDSLRWVLAKFFEEINEYKTAAAYWDTLLKSGKWTKEALFEGGRIFLLCGNYEKAIYCLNGARKFYPEEEKVRNVSFPLGVAYENIKKYEDAIYEYERCLETDSLLKDYAMLRIGVCKRAMKKKSEANRIFGILAERGGESAVSKLALAELKGGKREVKIITVYPDTGTPRVTSGFKYARKLMQKGDYESAIAEFRKIAKRNPRSLKAHHARYYIGRCMEWSGKRKDAIKEYLSLAQEYPSSSYADEAMWRAGFAQYIMGQTDSALAIFNDFIKRYWKSEYFEEVCYFSGKCFERKGDSAGAINMYVKASANRPFVYHARKGQWKADSLNSLMKGDSLNIKENVDSLKVTEWIMRWSKIKSDTNRWAILTRRKLYQKAELLYKFGFKKEGTMEIAPLEGQCWNNPYLLFRLGQMYLKNGEDNRAMVCGRRIIRMAPSEERSSAPKDVLLLLYPVKYLESISRNGSLDKAFVLAVMREESAFKINALSKAGARGLMQVMPNTGRKIAKQLGLEEFKIDDLYDPYSSIQFGVTYLKMMSEKFQYKKELVAASYNAGPNAVEKWLSNINSSDIDEFIEEIPFVETREYVKMVMASYWMYTDLLNRRGSY